MKKDLLLGFGTGIFLFLLPFVNSDAIFYGAVNTKFFFILAIIDAFALVYAWHLLRDRTITLTRGGWMLAGSAALVLVAYYTSAYLGVFFERSLWSDILRSTGLLFVTHIALFGLLLGLFLDARGWQVVRRSVVLSAGLFGVLSIIGTSGFGFDEQIWPIDFNEEGLAFGNSTFAGVYLLLAFMIGLIELARSWKDLLWKKLIMGTLVVTALCPVLFNTGILFGRVGIDEVIENPTFILGAARASSATLILLLVFLAGVLGIRRLTSARNHWRPSLMWGMTMLLGMVVAIGLLFTPGSAVQEAYIDASTGARILVWNAGWEALTERPYFGWGPENFNHAFEQHFDNRLYLDEYIGEVWFDRAHNFFVDTLVSVGAVGMVTLLLAACVFVYVVYRAQKRRVIGDTEALILFSLIPLHVLQLQTGFDTVASYVLLGVLFGYGVYLERASTQDSAGLTVPYGGHICATALLIGVVASAVLVWYPELERQRALKASFTAGFEEQRELVAVSLSQISDWESLRLSSGSFIKGAFSGVSEATNKRDYVREVVETAELYEEYFARYLEAHPDYYRAYTNYAYLLILETAFGQRKLQDALPLVRASYEMSPDNPLSYALESMIFLYGINFNKAQSVADEMVALNPDIEFSQEVHKYIDEQILRFPKNSTLLLENI